MKNLQKKSTLQEKDGVLPPKNISRTSVNKLKVHRKKKPTPEDLVTAIMQGDRVALSRAITLIESTHEHHSKDAHMIIERCLPRANASIRIGITGVPGVGKSTFIEVFGTYLTQLGRKVAVLAVDPSSTISGGSILGDKTRMETLTRAANAFIRPSPSGDTLGGVARKTRETIIVCEACGFDTIIVETVGVGQSEMAVRSMVDFFLLLKLAGAGDELQGIKRGIMEAADAIVIHKADGENLKAAQRAKTDFSRAIHLYPPKENGWIPKVLTASAIKNKGIQDIWELIQMYVEQYTENGFFEQARLQQNTYWLLQTIEEQLKTHFYQHPNIVSVLASQKKAVARNELSPFAAAQHLLSLYYGH